MAAQVFGVGSAGRYQISNEKTASQPGSVIHRRMRRLLRRRTSQSTGPTSRATASNDTGSELPALAAFASATAEAGDVGSLTASGRGSGGRKLAPAFIAISG